MQNTHYYILVEKPTLTNSAVACTTVVSAMRSLSFRNTIYVIAEQHHFVNVCRLQDYNNV